MQYLEQSPVVSIFRLYDQPGGYEARAPYKATVLVQWKSRTEVYLFAAVGVVDREARHMLFDMLRKDGVTKVEMERRGKMKTINL